MYAFCIPASALPATASSTSSSPGALPMMPAGVVSHVSTAAFGLEFPTCQAKNDYGRALAIQGDA